MNLSADVSSISKIGPKYKKILGKLGIDTVSDLLYHFPFRYDNYSNIKKIADLELGETVTIIATLEDVQNIYTKYRKRITQAKVKDESGEISIIWFNQHYIKQSLKIGEKYNFSGKVAAFNDKFSFIAPDYELASSCIHTGRLVPIYPETYGVSSKYLRNRINDVLSREKVFEEFLPETLINRHKLTNFDKAVRNLHFPDNLFETDPAKERFAYEELFLELLKVETRKNEWNKKLKGIKMEKIRNREKLDQFIENLPFKLTESQKAAVDQILEDMNHSHPMNRLLEGDVGTGKTVVAVIASYFSYLNGYKTLYMAPTEILANQHFDTFIKLLDKYGIKVEKATGSHKAKDNGWDVLIGTHALLFNKIDYEKIGLVVIDEQHRFGVEQRAKLLELGKAFEIPHLLTMTATPIPRTLALTLFGDLSISSLKAAPNRDKKITTTVIPDKQRIKAYEMIKSKNEPTFIVCPLIEESESTSLVNVKAAQAEFESLKEGIFKGMNVGLLHGRMKSKEKQEIIEKFRKGDIKILVSTPVIEVGIDIPQATIMVIESAERYGLASLHQLRGRVGRGDKPGFCLIFMSNNSRNSYYRLKNLEKINNGLELAEIDMKIRGEGDLYGTMQHGFKRFKVADIGNLELLESAKIDAQEIYPDLDKYPLLKEKLSEKGGKFIGNN